MKKLKRLALFLVVFVLMVSSAAVSTSAAGPSNWQSQVYWDFQYGYIRYVPAGVECYELVDYAYSRYREYNTYSSLKIYDAQGKRKGDQVPVATGDVLHCTTPKANRHVISVFGDVNGDGEITVADVSALRDLIATGPGTVRHDNPYDYAGDINKDGYLTVSDVSALRDLIAS